MALEFVLQRLVSHGDPAPPAPVGDLLRAWRAEALVALNIFGWQLPWRWRRFADHLPADAPGRRDLVLVHGFVCNRGLWNAWWPTCAPAAYPASPLNLEPVFGSIDRYAPRVEPRCGA